MSKAGECLHISTFLFIHEMQMRSLWKRSRTESQEKWGLFFQLVSRTEENCESKLSFFHCPLHHVMISDKRVVEVVAKLNFLFWIKTSPWPIFCLFCEACDNLSNFQKFSCTPVTTVNCMTEACMSVILSREFLQWKTPTLLSWLTAFGITHHHNSAGKWGKLCTANSASVATKLALRYSQIELIMQHAKWTRFPPSFGRKSQWSMAFKPTDSSTVSSDFWVSMRKNSFTRTSTGNESDDKLDKIGVYFNEANNFNYVPRSVNVDLVSVLPYLITCNGPLFTGTRDLGQHKSKSLRKDISSGQFRWRTYGCRY